MAKVPQYRLQTLLALRESKKQEAERFLGECIAALKAEEERLQEMEKELVRMVQKRERKQTEYAEKQMRGEMDARDALSANLYVERLKEQEEMQKDAISGQQAVVRQKEEDVTAAREELVKANQEVKALEKHKDKWLEACKKEIENREADALDEVAQTIYLGQQRGDS